jgi:ABC transport system ATP-binding/permease protein
LCVPSPLVSRDHARILVSSNTVTVVDVGSVNGCFVNHRQVKKQVLREGDVLRFADRAYKLTLA